MFFFEFFFSFVVNASASTFLPRLFLVIVKKTSLFLKTHNLDIQSHAQYDERTPPRRRIDRCKQFFIQCTRCRRGFFIFCFLCGYEYLILEGCSGARLRRRQPKLRLMHVFNVQFILLMPPHAVYFLHFNKTLSG